MFISFLVIVILPCVSVIPCQHWKPQGVEGCLLWKLCWYVCSQCFVSGGKNWMALGKNRVTAISTEIFKYVRIHPNFASRPLWCEKMFLCCFSLKAGRKDLANRPKVLSYLVYPNSAFFRRKGAIGVGGRGVNNDKGQIRSIESDITFDHRCKSSWKAKLQYPISLYKYRVLGAYFFICLYVVLAQMSAILVTLLTKTTVAQLF